MVAATFILLALSQAVYVSAALLSKTGWTATASSYQAGNEPGKILDGNDNTFWHSQFSPLRVFPHWILIDMKQPWWVHSMTLLPRQGSLNGNIGQHTIELSMDGKAFTKVALGSFLDDQYRRVAEFSDFRGRYIRITATSEAGNRGQWSSIAEINVWGQATYTVPPRGQKGLWALSVNFPIVPVAAYIVPTTGKILTWSAYRAREFGGGRGFTQTSTWDPATNIVSRRTVSNTGHDMFCPGISLDFNGRPIVTGGNDAAKVSAYNAGSDSWVALSPMKIPRGYQSSATCSDGRIFTIGGSWSGGMGGKNGEIYDPNTNTWTLLPGCPVAPMLTADPQGIYRSDNHAWLFGWKNGYVFQAGPSKQMNWYSIGGPGGQRGAGNRAADIDSTCGNAVMYDAVAGKILTAGGAPSYSYVEAHSNAHIITLGTPPNLPSVQKVQNMAYRRSFANGIALPNGQVLIIGGQSRPVPFSDAQAILIPELFTPSSGTFTQMAPIVIARAYHSVGLLMRDGTVFSGGGGLCGTCTANHFDAQIYYPPYFFNADGSWAARPGITGIDLTTVRVGGAVVIKTTMAITRVSLHRYGSSTHSVDTDSRRISLGVTGSQAGGYRFVIPGDSGVALPGYWMVFAVTAGGVPGGSKTIKITR